MDVPTLTLPKYPNSRFCTLGANQPTNTQHSILSNPQCHPHMTKHILPADRPIHHQDTIAS
ncbi:hypothetical protein BDW62DRAFT_181980 [Aspergillus aurantiobrunneus]